MTQKIDPAWVQWAKQTIELLRDGGYMVYPRDGAIFQVNKVEETVTLVCCRPDWIGSDVENTNNLVLAKAGFRYIKPDNVPTDPDGMVKAIFGHLQKYASDIPTLLSGIGTIFRLTPQALDAVVNRHGKLPINPVTIRGERTDEAPNLRHLSVGRLWIGTDTVPDAPTRFNPAQRRGTQWEKPVTLVIWRDANDMSDAKGMIVDEEDYIPAMKRLRDTDDIVLKLWGKPQRKTDEKWAVVFRRSPVNRTMLVTFYSGDTAAPFASAAVNPEKFFEGMGHLFPNGELER